MPLFRRAVWPRDHRDELVAGALVGAVVIVLGYASGIGAPSAAEAAVPPATRPAVPAPATSVPSGGQAPVGSGELPSYGGGGAGIGYGGGGMVTGTVPVGGSGGSGGHAGHETPVPPGTGFPTTGPTPTPTPTSPSTPTPAPTAGCEDGEVTLVQPLLTGLTEPVLGLLGGATPSPSPTPSPCVGVAPVSGLLGGILAGPSAASPQPEATP